MPAGYGFGSAPAASTLSTMVGVSASGPVCFALWSSDRYGRLSTGHVTTTAQAKLTQAPNANISPPDAFGTVGEGTNSIAFSDASTDDGRIVSRTWDFGDPGSGAANGSSLPAPAHTFAEAGSYVVTLTVTDDDGLTSTASANVEIG